jgi:hypothetical protein
MMVFKGVVVKSVTSNVAKGVISFSFQVAKTDESMQTAESLAFFVDKGQLTLMIENRQMSFSVAQEEKKEGA